MSIPVNLIAQGIAGWLGQQGTSKAPSGTGYNMIPSLLKAAGNIGGYFINRQETARANRYNEPKQQMARLREAGLPYQAAEAFGNQHVGVSDTSGFGRAGEGLAGFIDDAKTIKDTEKTGQDIQKGEKEIAILDNQIGYWAAKYGIETLDLGLKSEEVNFLLEEGLIVDGQWKNWYTHAKEIEIKTKTVMHGIASNEKIVKEIEANIAQATSAGKIDLTAAQLEYMNKQIALATQTIENTESFNTAKNTVIDIMSRGGLGFGEALILMILQSFSASGSYGGVKVGN